MKKTLIILSVLFIPFFANACTYPTPPPSLTSPVNMNKPCTGEYGLANIAYLEQARTLASRSTGNLSDYDNAIETCQAQITQYQADMQAYNNCLSSLPATPPVMHYVPAPSSTAPGTIQLMDFTDPYSINVGSDLTGYFVRFVYSGSRQLGASIVGSLPPGVILGSINYGTNGIDTVRITGTPTKIGNYPFSLIITDNNGALIVKPLNLVVKTLFKDATLPNATPNKPYSQVINFYYGGSNTPRINFSTSSPSDFYLESTSVNGYSGVVTLKLTPFKAGQFTIKADAIINGITVDTKTFNLTVANPTVVTPATPPVVTQQPTNQVSNPPPIKKVITEKPVQPTTTINNTQEQNPTSSNQQQLGFSPINDTPQTPSNNQTNSKPHNIFSNIWNFIKNIFK